MVSLVTLVDTLATEMTGTMTLGQFILAEMERRQMSAREFARLVGVTHKTINKFVNGNPKGYPSMDFLAKLAKATHADPCYLLGLIIPDIVQEGSIKPDDLLLSQRIGQLPPDKRDAIDAIILGFALKDRQNTE